MSDDKAAAAYHPGDAPVTRLDLDALIVRLRFTGEHAGIPILLDAAAALAAERARADRAREWLRDNETWEPDFEALRTTLAE